jgi:hypothetical protein
MKITKQYLVKVIKEELAQTLNEYNPNGPIVLKKGMADYGEPGGLDELEPERTMQLDNDLDRMINSTRNAQDAIQTIDKYSDASGLSVPFGLALYAIARKFPDSDGVLKHFEDKIEGGPSGWRAQDYFTVGGGSVNYDKFKELYPKLSKHLGL